MMYKFYILDSECKCLIVHLCICVRESHIAQLALNSLRGCVDEDYLQVLILLSLPPKGWD